ncbi:putative exodeoxyribonuclease VII large subunit [Halobacteriovorax marinus SJ]|uniref:Exodeoxyribonuclease 7 large subunit n=1 Tax=Halobacteriovorax marinus (strain ATCC BAA-682 / DSM 15412 / SJ) TaxID=862908 RepID=E1WXI3_HALMS|nr:exodeoxyribonuclease VII large subunit [Halobacteriovorax marinus]CBW27500.1 putative exodeoxyribonuclease VII large subunit [Halobacteriovorax marinus SJ]
MSNIQYDSVSTLVGKVKGLLEGQFRSVSIEGEVTNLSLSSSGHYYFTLSDKSSALSACLFKMDAMRNPAIREIKNGDKVQCIGGIGVYAKRGSFQVIVKRITKTNVGGDLLAEFERLKKKLAGEGLFDLSNKNKIPTLPKKIAVITAQRGAALQDFLNITKRRTLWSNVMVVPALVQGEGAAASIRKALFNTIKYSLENKENAVDVIVLTRGGGSLEDLWAFNDEALAWDIFNCPIPIISAVGHQVDFSISDYVSDLRCETPSAAAQILSEGQSQIISRLENIKKHLSSSGREIILARKDRVHSLRPEALMNKVMNLYQDYKFRLSRCSLEKREFELLGLHEQWQRLDESLKRMNLALERTLKDREHRVNKSFNMLGALNPSNVLERGYSYMTDSSGHVVASSKEFSKLESGAELDIQFSDGKNKVSKV